MPEGTDAGQQDVQATGNAAATTPPVQPTPQPVQQATPDAQPAQSGNEWHNRYNGLQQVHQNTVAQLQQAQALLQQNSQHTGTLEQQLTVTQAEQATQAQTLGDAQQQLAGLQTENAFWQLVSNEYTDLLPIANVLQRNPDADAQRAILNTARASLGNTVQQQAQTQVAQAFQGVTPAGVPPALQAQNQMPSKESLIQQLDALRPGTPEYNKVKALWDRHPENGPQGLNPNFVDPMRNDWDRVRNVDTMEVVEDQTQTQGAWGRKP